MVKEELVESGLPSIVVRGSYGGSNLAVAAFNYVVKRVSSVEEG
nr:precorrin-8X methylmutase [Sulfodiicoccus acidiphilus]